MIKCKNFNAFTMVGILEQLNEFCAANFIFKNNIISITNCSNGSINLFYYEVKK